MMTSVGSYGDDDICRKLLCFSITLFNYQLKFVIIQYLNGDWYRNEPDTILNNISIIIKDMPQGSGLSDNNNQIMSFDVIDTKFILKYHNQYIQCTTLELVNLDTLYNPPKLIPITHLSYVRWNQTNAE